MNVTAVLLNWKRPHNMEPICRSLMDTGRISKIVLWDNSGTMETIVMDGLEIVRSRKNICTLGRFKAVRHADSEFIYTQDDDVIVNNVGELIETFFRVGGKKIVSGLTAGHFKHEANKTPWMQLGWGSVFSSKWIEVLNEWMMLYGENEVLQRKADRIFTILNGRNYPVEADVTPLSDPDGRLSQTSPDALYRRPDHNKLTADAVRMSQEILNARRNSAASGR